MNNINPYYDLKEYEGQTLKYDEFCKITGEPIKIGTQRQQQLKIIGNYIDIDSKYGKITINKIYNEQEILLSEHKAKFSEYIEDLLISYIATSKEPKITLTYREMAEYFYMINKEYYKAKYEKWSYVDELKITTNSEYTDNDMKEDIYKGMGLFFNITDKLIKEIIDNALQSLKNKSLIIAHDNFKLYKKEYNSDIDEYIIKEYTCNSIQRQEFINIRKSVMNKHNIKKLSDIVFLKKDERDLFFDDLAYEMSQSEILYHCPRYANAWDIEYGDKAISYEYKRIQSKNQLLVNSNMKYKLLTTKELECIQDILKKQMIGMFI